MTPEEEHRALDMAWFAIWTRSRQEKVVATMFESYGIMCYLPLTSEIHHWSDRKQTVTIPLFKGYLFARLNPARDSRLRILNTPGVAGLVGNQSGPLPVPDYEIENLRTVIAQKVQYSVYPTIPVGTRVRVIRGVLAGVVGTLLRAQADSKLILSVEMIHRSIAVTIHASDVEPLANSPHENTLQGMSAMSVA